MDKANIYCTVVSIALSEIEDVFLYNFYLDFYFYSVS